LQETIQIGQEALLQREEILSKAEDSDDGKRNSLESMELENAHVHQIHQTVANVPKEFGNQEVAKEEKRLKKWEEAQTEQVREFQILQPSQKELSISESIDVKSSQEDSSQENVLQNKSTPDANCQMGSVKLLPCTQSYMLGKVGAACVKSEVTDELIGPRSHSIKVIDEAVSRRHNGKTYPDEDYVFDKMLESEIVLMRDMCWNYEWWVFKIGWKQKTVQQAEIESWSSFVFQYSKEDEVLVFYLKHRWCWKTIRGILWNGHAGAAPESAHCSAPVNKTKVF
jgi:hypothetical protein